MKFIITESQHRRLLSEQKIYTNKREYDKALVRYNDVMRFRESYNQYNEARRKVCRKEMTIAELEIIDRKTKEITEELRKKYGEKFLIILGMNEGFSLDKYYQVYCYKNENEPVIDSKEFIRNRRENGSELIRKWAANSCNYKWKEFGSGYVIKEPIKPIYKGPAESSIEVNSGSTSNQTNSKKETEPAYKSFEPIKTKYVIEFLWGGNRKLVYFNTYEDYSKIVGSVDKRLGGNSTENASRTSAESEIYKDPSELGLGVKGKSDASLSIVFIWSGYKKVVWFKTYEEFNKVCSSVDKSRKGNFTEDASGTWARCEIYASPSEFGL